MFAGRGCEGAKVTDNPSLDAATVPPIGPAGPESDTVPGTTEFPQHVRFRYPCRVWAASCRDAVTTSEFVPRIVVIALCTALNEMPVRSGSAIRTTTAEFTNTPVAPSNGVT